MASTHKTFADGEILTASDVNDALNPTTADHIPFAVAADGVVIASTTIAAGAVLTGPLVTFPAGRFTQSPVVVGNVRAVSAGDARKLVVQLQEVTATSGRIYVGNPTSSPITSEIHVAWIAVQMTP